MPLFLRNQTEAAAGGRGETMGGGRRTTDQLAIVKQPRLAPAGTLPGAPIGSPPPPAALSGTADRLSRAHVAAALRHRAKLRRWRAVRGEPSVGGLRKHVRVAQVRCANFERINLEYSLGRMLPRTCQPQPAVASEFFSSRGYRLVMFCETKL